ncbi:MAG: insulinase family protein [Geminocystis sp.]|nr:insulinase family protein [Geminocystis sp.]
MLKVIPKILVIIVLILGLENLLDCPPFALADSGSILPYLERAKENITEFTLENEIKFIVLKNSRAPVISFVTYVDVGAVNEPEGQTGIAHFLEHLAFKGTREIGTLDYEKEERLLKELDSLFEKIKQAKTENDQEKVKKLEAKFEQINKQAHELVKQNEFGQIVELEGGVGLNATTSADATVYYYSFPANKLELWMYLESERFLHPVFREFYEEKQVILEERRLRVDNSPIGKLIEAFLDVAFTSHPYKRPVIGYQEDISNLTRQNVQDFFEKYYGGKNITIAIVGDVEAEEVKRLARKYFGRFPPGNKSTPPIVNEPPQTSTREITIHYPSQPLYLEGYHIPDINNPDYVICELMGSILADGRTSRLYQSMVEKQKIALSVSAFAGFPGEKYPNLMVFYATPTPNTPLATLETSLHEEIEKLTEQLVSVEELTKVKTQAKASLLRTLDSNMGMARLLAKYEAITGDWRNLFLDLDKISAVTPQDIQRVARLIFTPENRIVARLLPPNPNP